MEPFTPIQTRHPHELRKIIKADRLCPKCGSFFVDESACEACGYQLQKDYLGPPFGDKSFFFLNQDFLDERPKFCPDWVWRDHFFTKKHQKFKRALYHRFQLLKSYFFEHVDSSLDRRKQFLFEFRQVIKTYIFLGGDASLLWKELEPYEEKVLYPTIINEVRAGEKAYSQKKSFLTLILEKKVAEFFEIRFVLKVILAVGAVLASSMLAYKFLALSTSI
jgi:ribosomal protein S27AE